MAQLTVSGMAMAVDFGDVQHAELIYNEATRDYTLATYMGNGEKHFATFPRETDATSFVAGHKSRFRRATIVWLGTKIQ